MQEAARNDFQMRVTSLQRLVCLPPMAKGAYQQIAASGRQRALDQLLLQGPGAAEPRQGGGAQAAGAGGGGSTSEEGASSSSEALSRLSQGGAATWNADAYEARLRLLALCGWDVKVVTADGSGGGEPSIGSPGGVSGAGTAAAAADGSHVGPECSALFCALCSAKAGLWTFFPACQPRVQAAPMRSGQASFSWGGAAGTPQAGKRC